MENIELKINLLKMRIDWKKDSIRYWQRMIDENNLDIGALQKELNELDGLIKMGEEHDAEELRAAEAGRI